MQKSTRKSDPNLADPSGMAIYQDFLKGNSIPGLDANGNEFFVSLLDVSMLFAG